MLFFFILFYFVIFKHSKHSKYSKHSKQRNKKKTFRQNYGKKTKNIPTNALRQQQKKKGATKKKELSVYTAFFFHLI